jgi:general secretion pathway protein N
MSKSAFPTYPAAAKPPYPDLRVSRWAVAGALTGALWAMVMWAPARWLAEVVRYSTGQKLVLVDPRGTVWQGSARFLLTGGAGSRDVAVLPERVQWAVWPTLSGFDVGMLAACCTPKQLKLHLSPRLNGVRLELADAQANWPASWLVGLGTPWNTLELTGQLSVQTQGLRADWRDGHWSLAGSAVLEARNISSRLSTLRPLGSYRIRLEGGSPIRLSLETLEGSLRLAGSGQWAGQQLKFLGEASAAPDREAALANFLNIVGRRHGARSIITLGPVS